MELARPVGINIPSGHSIVCLNRLYSALLIEGIEVVIRQKKDNLANGEFPRAVVTILLASCGGFTRFAISLLIHTGSQSEQINTTNLPHRSPGTPKTHHGKQSASGGVRMCVNKTIKPHTAEGRVHRSVTF